MDWTSATQADVEALIAEELPSAEASLASWFERIRTPTRSVAILRFGEVEHVQVVAQVDGMVVYYEDVEEGFNFSALDADGAIATPRFEQWTLHEVLWHLRDHLRRTQSTAAP